MQLLIKTPRKSINKAYLKTGATREEIVLLKKNLGGLFRLIDENVRIVEESG